MLFVVFFIGGGVVCCLCGCSLFEVRCLLRFDVRWIYLFAEFVVVGLCHLFCILRLRCSLFFLAMCYSLIVVLCFIRLFSVYCCVLLCIVCCCSLFVVLCLLFVVCLCVAVVVCCVVVSRSLFVDCSLLFVVCLLSFYCFDVFRL